MFFNKAKIYRLTKGFELSAEQLGSKLHHMPFVECGPHDFSRSGFVAPIEGSEMLVHANASYMMICVQREEKVLPSASIKAATAKKVKDIESREDRKLGRKEKQTIKDEVIFSMLPRAFTKVTKTYAYIDVANSLLVVNSSSNQAEQLCSKLRDALGSLPCIPVSCKVWPSHAMTTWISASTPFQNFSFGEACTLFSNKQHSEISTKRFDLGSPEIITHVSNGMQVGKLSLDYKDQISFVIDDSLQLSRIKFSTELVDGGYQPETFAEQFDADFVIMTESLRALFNDLFYAFGGIVRE